MIEIGTEASADDALFHDGEFGRQGARAQVGGEARGFGDTEVAGDLAAAAEDRFIDARRRDHLVVEHDGKPATDIFRGKLSECAGAGLIEAERHNRLVGALVEARLGVGQLFAGDLAAAFDQFLATVAARQDLVTRRNSASARLVNAHCRMDQMEGQLGDVKAWFDDLDVFDAGRLQQDAVGALTLHHHFLVTAGVASVAHDF